jgi:ribosomal protein L12E/L44/L45/RPP1/RPP2
MVRSLDSSALKKRVISEVVPNPALGAHGTVTAGGEVKDEKGPAKKKLKMTEAEKEEKRKEKEAKEKEREAKVCFLWFFLFDQPAAGGERQGGV